MRTSWRAALVVVAVVAAGCGNGSDGGGAGGGRPLLPVGEAGAGTSSTTSAAMVKSADAATGEASTAIAPMPYQPVEYRLADGAKAPATKAQAYELVLPKDDPSDRVAKALGVDADEIEVDLNAAWFYSPSSPDTPVSSSSVAASCVAGTPEGECVDTYPTEPAPLEGVPSAADAEAKARRIFTALGLGDDEGEVTVDGADGQYRMVTFTPAVDGVPVPALGTMVQFGAHAQIDVAHGAVFETKAIGEYPLVSLEAAFDRYQHGFGGVVADALPAETGASTGAATSSGGETVRVPPTVPLPKSAEGQGEGQGGSTGTGTATGVPEPAPMPVETAPPVTLEPRVVEVTGARLVLEPAAAGCEDDPIYLVPAFQLRPESDFGVVTAVTDASLAQTTAGTKQASSPDDQLCPEDQPAQDEPGVEPQPEPAPATVPPDAGTVEPQPAPAPGQAPNAGAGSTGSGSPPSKP